MQKKEVNEILLEFFMLKLGNRGSFHFPAYVIETELPLYGQQHHNTLHSPSTYARGFRKMREKKKYPADWEIIESTSPVSRVKLFTIRRINEKISGNS